MPLYTLTCQKCAGEKMLVAKNIAALIPKMAQKCGCGGDYTYDPSKGNFGGQIVEVRGSETQLKEVEVIKGAAEMYSARNKAFDQDSKDPMVALVEKYTGERIT